MAGRPKIPRKTCCVAECTCFKPNKYPKDDFGVDLLPDEIEAIDLCDRQNLKQKEAAEKMKISQPTLGRILASAHQKLAQAVIKGGEIRID
jgi:uncharacterized protein